MSQKPYTVILLRPDYIGDYPEFFSAHTLSKDVKEAVAHARAEAVAVDDVAPENMDDYMVVACYAGHLENMSDLANE